MDESLIRWSAKRKPSMGGISFFIAFLLVLVQFPILFSNQGIAFNIQLIGFITACGIAFLMGLADDAYNTNPYLKISLQALSAIVLIASGTYIQLFENDLYNYLISFIWIVGMMNSINMLDNMDGVASIASIFGISAILTVLIYSQNVNHVFFSLMLGIVAALIAFLFFNWHPSKMFMGDTGSQFLGVSLAALSILFLWNFNAETESKSIPQQILLPILAFLVPLSDTTTVVINRLSEGKSPFIGGKDHTTHHLSYLGYNDQSVAFIVAGLGLISTVVCLVAVSITQWSYLFTILFAVYAISVFLSLFLITRFNKKNQQIRNEPKERQINRTA
jgi:UDP-GlcNAc:undecaprenyl-phosphate GlcNAc-1-phosphate transferase